jgi:hypothetical protein
MARGCRVIRRGFARATTGSTSKGDYRNPPPEGMYEALHEHAKRAMKREPVHLDREQRQRALDEVVASFQRRRFKLGVVSVDAIHLHGLVRCPDRDPKRWIGIAKKESSHYCKETGHAPVGGIWATGSKCLPVRDQKHWYNVRKYIRDHRLKGAVVWLYVPEPGRESFDPDSLSLE